MENEENVTWQEVREDDIPVWRKQGTGEEYAGETAEIEILNPVFTRAGNRDIVAVDGWYPRTRNCTIDCGNRILQKARSCAVPMGKSGGSRGTGDGAHNDAAFVGKYTPEEILEIKLKQEAGALVICVQAQRQAVFIHPSLWKSVFQSSGFFLCLLKQHRNACHLKKDEEGNYAERKDRTAGAERKHCLL